MELNSSLNQSVETLFSNLESFTQKEGLLGKPVTHGDKTFIPVVSLTVGYGGGNGANKNNTASNQANNSNQENSGMLNLGAGALGLGAKINTEAIVVIDKDNVSMMTISAVANASNLLDKIPQMVMGMNQNKQQNQSSQQKQQ